ncbi:hypothetical protein [Helicobacter typhlonius]|uniref:hypothetical protein n=1 Tax=Helicobacter typhlonius TaxID=76936 RepID=UPI002FE4065E
MKNTLSSMTLDDSTIVAIATPVGVGAISIVRLSGKNACEIILRLTHRDSLKARYAHLCRIYDTQGASIDEAIVLYFPAPRSYTTQDVCEVQCHGGRLSSYVYFWVLEWQIRGNLPNAPFWVGGLICLKHKRLQG